ncbi:MAG: hypothetical protein J6L73_03465 [Muribaculaceae bacterium]|nr:hypothetical protein [Muribaculaceae bacterium]
MNQPPPPSTSGAPRRTPPALPRQNPRPRKSGASPLLITLLAVIALAAVAGAAALWYNAGRHDSPGPEQSYTDSLKAIPAEQENHIDIPASQTQVRTVIQEPEPEPAAETSVDKWTAMFRHGVNRLSGNMVYKGQYFPIELTLDVDTHSGRIVSASYRNVSYGVVLRMTPVSDPDPSYVRLTGHDGRDPFMLRFSYDGEGTASGTATLGSRHGEVYLDLL